MGRREARCRGIPTRIPAGLIRTTQSWFAGLARKSGGWVSCHFPILSPRTTKPAERELRGAVGFTIARGSLRVIMRAIEDVLNRLRSYFLGVPGLELTSEQAQGLCGVERTICRLVLDSLVETKFLCRKAGGAYALMSAGDDRLYPEHAKAVRRADRPCNAP